MRSLFFRQKRRDLPHHATDPATIRANSEQCLPHAARSTRMSISPRSVKRPERRSWREIAAETAFRRTRRFSALHKADRFQGALLGCKADIAAASQNVR
jgi:hypothetical protein